MLLAGLAALGAAPASSPAAPALTPVAAVGAESQYADVIAAVGGRYVHVSAVERSPTADPHSFEASPAIAREVASAGLIVQNGLGYDAFMNHIEDATSSTSRRVIDVQALLRLPDSTPNPHLWYAPATMPAVASAVVGALAARLPSQAAYFRANAARFDRTLAPWRSALSAFARAHPHTPLAVTEPVADDALAAAGVRILTPWSFQADVMNGLDPAPQDVGLEESLLSGRRVRVLLYNEQVTDPLTSSLLADARAHHVPVVAVYETMPAGYHYGAWMLAELRALERAVTTGASTQRL